MTALLDLDWLLFRFINSGMSNPFLDWLAPIARYPYTCVPVYAFLLYWFISKFKKQAWIPVLGLLLCFGITDQLSANLIKKNVQRLRPCNEPYRKEMVQLRIEKCGVGYSFVSSHACNHFGISVFLISLLGAVPATSRFRKYTPGLLLLWAALVGFSQIYVGVHYPLDVIAGGSLGALCGWACARLTRFVLSRRSS